MKWNLTKIIIAIGVLAIPVPLRLSAQAQPQDKKDLPGATAATADYNFLIASGFLCDPDDSAPCPAVARATNGETIDITGAGTLGVASKSVTAIQTAWGASHRQDAGPPGCYDGRTDSGRGCGRDPHPPL